MDEKAIEKVTKKGRSVINPEGVLYMTAGSSSGSKYYDWCQDSRAILHTAGSRMYQHIPLLMLQNNI